MGRADSGKPWATAIGLALLAAGIALGQTQVAELKSGRDIFRAACVACHGTDGRGAPDATRGFELPSTFPDFTDCNATTREPDLDWNAIINNGGPGRGFSEIMPSFREALTADQIDKVIEYLRGFCREPSWPRGELNLPRALVTEKAYPEDEAVVDAAIDTKTPRNITNHLVYERRFGVRNQIDISVPFAFQQSGTGNWFGGVGDISLGFKRMLASSLRTGSIFSLAGEATLPTGNAARGLGNGVTILETFASFGQLLPKNSFFQFQGGFEVPTHMDDANKAVYWRTVLGKTFIEDQGRGRLWSPMVELLADRELASGETINWDVLPQIQVTLSSRQHIRADFGVRIPANNTADRSPAIMFYVLWDWFDGGLRDGWK
jgi:mono/diheme cytochrome c family protein